MGADRDREMFIFPVQLTTSRIGNLTRLIHTLAICDDHANIYILLLHDNSTSVQEGTGAVQTDWSVNFGEVQGILVMAWLLLRILTLR